MNLIWRSTFVVLLFIASIGWALPPTVEQVPIGIAFLPQGFDDNDNVQVTFEGEFPSSCYKVGPTKLSLNGNVIEVTQTAYKYQGPCLDMIVPFYITVDAGILKAGRYTVADSKSGAKLGELPIAISKTPGADDYLYAPITDADIENNFLILKGVIRDRCTVLNKVLVRNVGNVIEALPIAERLTGIKCERGYYPFKTRVELPGVLHGHFLLHVRSLEGRAINKVLDI